VIVLTRIHWSVRGTGTPKDRFASGMGECVILTPQVRRRYSKTSVVL
jgi:hypothetical protein